jgi:hypothetical protein
MMMILGTLHTISAANKECGPSTGNHTTTITTSRSRTRRFVCSSHDPSYPRHWILFHPYTHVSFT